MGQIHAKWGKIRQKYGNSALKSPEMRFGGGPAPHLKAGGCAECLKKFQNFLTRGSLSSTHRRVSRQARVTPKSVFHDKISAKHALGQIQIVEVAAENFWGLLGFLIPHPTPPPPACRAVLRGIQSLKHPQIGPDTCKMGSDTAKIR